MLCCPQCGSRLLYKDGLRCLADGSSIQRYLCRNCGYRFSETRKSNIALHTKSESDAHQKAAKLLVEAEKAIEKREAGATEACFDVKGKILEFAWLLKKQGYSEETIRLHVSALRTLHKRGADLYNPESVKEVITWQKWSETRRRNVINAYSRFLKHEGIQWDKPRCKVSQKLPFIPTEQELDALIAGSGSKTSVLMQLLKETAMRAGEAMKLKWTDIDFERRIVTLNEPEKGSKPRMWKVSEKLIGMLKSLPRENEKVFGKSRYDTLKQTLQKTRKRLAVKLQNPRLAKITFHTFRHWKATMLYHKTKDPYYVKDFLGHKSIKNTEIYITVERAIFGDSCNDEFTVKVASNPEEIKALLEVGFEYVCEKDGLLFFRKRK
jgi:integrase